MNNLEQEVKNSTVTVINQDVQQVIGDGSEIFTSIKSNNPNILINEQIDNALGAKPNIIHINYDDNQFVIMNDGVIPSHEEHYKIIRTFGESVSQRKGVSRNGFGDIASLLSSRKNIQEIAHLEIEIYYNHTISKSNRTVNSIERKLYLTEFSELGVSDKSNMIIKRFKNICSINKKYKENELEIFLRLKATPYMQQNKNFKIFLNEKDITSPIDIEYKNIDNEKLIKRFNREYTINYNELPIHCSVNIVKVHKYVKPDGTNIDKENANAFDAFYKLNADNSGLFIQYGETYVIYGGMSSWDLINYKYHSTISGYRVILKFDENEKIKDLLFSESQIKNSIGTCLSDIEDQFQNKIFAPIIQEIVNVITQWKAEDKKEKELERKKQEDTKKSAVDFLEALKSIIKNTDKSILSIYETKKFRTLIKEAMETKNE